MAKKTVKKTSIQFLEIKRQSLLSFAFSHWLPGDKEDDFLMNGSLSDHEFCRTMHGIGTVAHYLYGQQPLTDDVVSQIIQLLSRYCHEALKIPHRIDFRAHLLHAERGEPVLHSLKPFYRDHFFHVLEVCFLGHVLLETEVEENKQLWEYVASLLKLKNKNEVLRLWYMTALLHDIGYAMDVLNSSRKFLSFFKHSSFLSDVDKKITDAISNPNEEHKKEIEKIRLKYKPGMEQDHGIVGALHLSSLLKKIAKDSPHFKAEEYLPAVRAIALHNLRDIYDKISFPKDPLAFLLAICDQIQEWRRPRLPYSTSPDWFIAKLGNPEFVTREIEGSFRNITSNIEVEGEELKLKFKRTGGKAKLEFTINYDDTINKSSAVFNNWIDTTLNFQRLDFEEIPLDISIAYESPYYKNPNSNLKQLQLHRLRDAAHDTHMTFLSDWFPKTILTALESKVYTNNSKDKVLTNNGAITHIDFNSEQKEKIIFDLNKLSGKAYITKGMDVFWNKIKEWKSFNDDREFPGDYVSTIPE